MFKITRRSQYTLVGTRHFPNVYQSFWVPVKIRKGKL